MLGKNKKNIIILINQNETAFLPEDDLNFLIGILTACRLTMEDVGIVNIAKNNQINYHSFEKEIIAKTVLLFGFAPSLLDLPLSFPNYQIQAYNNITYLSSPSLAALREDKPEKMKLWTCLKTMFAV